MKCNKCGIDRDISEFEKGRRQCRLCMNIIRRKYHTAEYKREYLRQHPEKRKEMKVRYDTKYPEKYHAVQVIHNAIEGKHIERKPCEICGCMDVHGHHDDYYKPLTVRWLCIKHHNDLHNKNI